VELSKATIAVTGATGFLGGYLVRKLRARGAHVVAVVRNREKAAELLPRDVEIRLADLSDPARLSAAFASVDAVISNAAVISFRAPAETLRTNVAGTRNVFEALAQQGVKRAVAISSSAAYPLSFRNLDERTPLQARRPAWFGNAYGQSKAESERIAWQLAAVHDVALTTFRPCGITGPADPLLIANIARALRTPIAVLPAFMTIGVAHGEDVAEAVALALEQPAIASGKAYNLQGETVSLWQLARAWRAAGGRAPRLRVPVPLPISLRYDDALVRSELGWRPRSLSSIVEEAVQARRERDPAMQAGPR
jgi:nucleoside-diphosphate-sugar epimerase